MAEQPKSRDALIAQKNLVQNRIVQVQKQMERERLQPRTNTKTMHRLEDQLDRLMAEETELRQAIDRAGA